MEEEVKRQELIAIQWWKCGLQVARYADECYWQMRSPFELSCAYQITRLHNLAAQVILIPTLQREIGPRTDQDTPSTWDTRRKPTRAYGGWSLPHVTPPFRHLHHHHEALHPCYCTCV